MTCGMFCWRDSKVWLGRGRPKSCKLLLEHIKSLSRSWRARLSIWSLLGLGMPFRCNLHWQSSESFSAWGSRAWEDWLEYIARGWLQKVDGVVFLSALLQPPASSGEIHHQLQGDHKQHMQLWKYCEQLHWQFEGLPMMLDQVQCRAAYVGSIFHLLLALQSKPFQWLLVSSLASIFFCCCPRQTCLASWGMWVCEHQSIVCMLQRTQWGLFYVACAKSGCDSAGLD